ncbi:hypothetical protein N7490_006194 [Penicillium lividum]|nr:hypothetical protein N7490_006194 [Penicillium lividum]
MLQDMREETWGWVVYRTTYRSNPAFHKAIKILASWIKVGVYKDLHQYGLENLDPTPNDKLWARHQLTVIEEPTALDGALLDAVRGHFEGWMNCSVSNLIRLWTSLDDGTYMEDAWNEIQDGVY